MGRIRMQVLILLLQLTFVTCTEPSCPNLLRGRDGRDGRPGRDGMSVVGLTGRNGKDGKDGVDCIECARGPVGPKGETGLPGINGTQGQQGFKGDTGAQGINGSKGETGSPGKDGVAGPKGDRGVCDEKVLEDLVNGMLRMENNIETLQQQVLSLKNETQNLKSILDRGNKIKQSYLPAGYDKYSVYDTQWQALHMAAAAACRVSTVDGGFSSHSNNVYPRQKGVTCRDICSQTDNKYCDAEVSLHGLIKQSTNHTEKVAYYFHYGCDAAPVWGDEVTEVNEHITQAMGYKSYCCCRKL